jgi:hypothetical protein
MEPCLAVVALENLGIKLDPLRKIGVATKAIEFA